jgi:hypothetical protein
VALSKRKAGSQLPDRWLKMTRNIQVGQSYYNYRQPTRSIQDMMPLEFSVHCTESSMGGNRPSGEPDKIKNRLQYQLQPEINTPINITIGLYHFPVKPSLFILQVKSSTITT